MKFCSFAVPLRGLARALPRVLNMAALSILPCVPALPSSADSLFFRVPTVNAVLPAFRMAGLAGGGDGGAQWAWTLAGDGEVAFSRDSSCHFAAGTRLVSPELDGSLYSSLELRLDMATLEDQSVLSDSNNYPVTLSYSDGVHVDYIVAPEGPGREFTVRAFPLSGLRPQKFRIEIAGASKYGSSYTTLIRSVSLAGTYSAPEMLAVPSSMSLSLPFPAGYDSCLVDIRRSERNAAGTDTICHATFDGGTFPGMSADAESFGREDYFHGYGHGSVSLSVPVVVMGVTDTVYLSFNTSKWVNSEVNTYMVAYNGSVIGTVSHPYEMPSGEWQHHEFSFVPPSSLGVLTISNTDPSGGRKEVRLIVDDLLVWQESMYTYRSIGGYPRAVAGDWTADGLYCNDTYRVLRQYTGTSSFGESVITTLHDETAMTAGEHLSLYGGGTLPLDGDFGGSVFMDSTSSVTGEGRVMGELCCIIVCPPGEWVSVGLPFAPHLVGAFIGGEACYLRENIDYHLHSYGTDDGGNYSFSPSARWEGYRGYLVKVPAEMPVDGDTLYVYSPKGTRVNSPHRFTRDGLYSHLANPYLYPVADVWGVFGADAVYRYDGGVFRLFTTADELRPLESVIVYGGSPNTAPRLIRIDDATSIDDDTDGAACVAIHDGAISLPGYSGRVRVVAVDGRVAFDGHVPDGVLIPLPRGIYLVIFGTRTVKAMV